MANTVKLKDGSYIDATGVYDTDFNQTQQEINNRHAFPSIVSATGGVAMYGWNGTTKTFTVTIPEDGLYIQVYGFHIVNAGSLSGFCYIRWAGIIGMVQEVPHQWDDYVYTMECSRLTAGVKTLSVTGLFNGGTSHADWPSGASFQCWKIAD